MTDENTDPLAEINAMKSVAEALTLLDEAACGRVLRWASDRFGAKIPVLQQSPASEVEEDISQAGDKPKQTEEQTYSDIADLYAASHPSNDPEKALIVGYWFQIIEGQGDFDSQRINKELKHLGHGVSNITSAMSSLIGRKPALVMQTKKSGNSQQARKKYKLTHEGIKRVKEMISVG